jgi:hypothetical protein
MHRLLAYKDLQKAVAKFEVFDPMFFKIKKTLIQTQIPRRINDEKK